MKRIGINDNDKMRKAVSRLLQSKVISLDTETTGVEFYDRIFSVILFTSDYSFYFNFNELTEVYLEKESFSLFAPLFDNPDIKWFIHNAIFDLAMIRKEGFDIKGRVYCTMTLERVIKNSRPNFSLDALAKDYGLPQKLGDEIKECINKNKFFTKFKIRGKDTHVKKLHFDFVPQPLMEKYGHLDGEICYLLGQKQRREIISDNLKEIGKSETSLTPVVVDMYMRGIKLDLDYCQAQFDKETEEIHNLKQSFLAQFKVLYSKSRLVLSSLFHKNNLKVPLTSKGNPSFTAEVLENIDHPLPKLILDIKKKEKFVGTYYSTYLTSHCDAVIRPFPKQSGTETGRFSYQSPNLQNVPRGSFLRRCFIPREDHFFVMIDYDQQEYRLLADLSCEASLIEQVLSGKDVHTATAELMGVDRTTAKTINFALLYGAGSANLAKLLGVSLAKAEALKEKYFKSLPRISSFIKRTIKEAKEKKHIRNFLGRKLHVKKNREFVAVNHLIQSSGADVVKLSMSRLHDFLSDYRSAMVLQVHDEIIFEVHHTEIGIIPHLKKIMESVYKPQHGLNLTCSVGYSYTSWGDKHEGAPDGKKTRDYFQRKSARGIERD